MSGRDKADMAKHKAEELTGKAKEVVGRATNNPELIMEGEVDQAAAKGKLVMDKLRDAAKKDE